MSQQFIHSLAASGSTVTSSGHTTISQASSQSPASTSSKPGTTGSSAGTTRSPSSELTSTEGNAGNINSSGSSTTFLQGPPLLVQWPQRNHPPQSAQNQGPLHHQLVKQLEPLAVNRPSLENIQEQEQEQMQPPLQPLERAHLEEQLTFSMAGTPRASSAATSEAAVSSSPGTESTGAPGSGTSEGTDAATTGVAEASTPRETGTEGFYRGKVGQ
ncbi:hypothetical protein I79_024927 [Cricetulus griseus]|uniref:Uncharacterized protein n=1 Tax=Cricetulus griseus TaxID=10029 RepID=G3IM00_CRIGR|nr:hypothetical protein I79_024927 [Cricetulus griseus]